MHKSCHVCSRHVHGWFCIDNFKSLIYLHMYIYVHTYTNWSLPTRTHSHTHTQTHLHTRTHIYICKNWFTYRYSPPPAHYTEFAWGDLCNLDCSVAESVILLRNHTDVCFGIHQTSHSRCTQCSICSVDVCEHMWYMTNLCKRDNERGGVGGGGKGGKGKERKRCSRA